LNQQKIYIFRITTNMLVNSDLRAIYANFLLVFKHCEIQLRNS